MAFEVMTLDFAKSVARLFQRYFIVMATLAIGAMIVGIGAEWLVGGTVATIAGTVQAFTVIVFVCWTATFYLFKPYGPKTTVVLEQPLVLILRLLLFIAFCGFTLFSAVFLGVRIIETVEQL